MMKFSPKLMLLPLCAFLLLGCTPSNDNNTSEIIASSSDSSSEISTSTSTSISSSETIDYGWDDETVLLMKQHLHDQVIPFVDIKDAYWIYDIDLDGMVFIKETNASQQDFDLFKTTLTKYGYVNFLDQSDSELGAFESVFIKELENYQTLHECIMVDSIIYNDGFMYANVYYQIDIKEWPKEQVKAQIKRVHGVSDVEMPEPSFTFLNVSIQGVANVDETEAKFVNIVFDVETLDQTELYKKDLTNAGWSLDEELNALVDPSKTLFVDYTPEELSEGYCVIVTVYKYSDFMM